MSSPSSPEISQVSTAPHPVRDALRWLLVLPAFPLSGHLVTTVIGPIDAPLPALAGGLIVGLAVGAAQLLGLRGRARALPWLLASGVGGALGLLAGSAVVGYDTTLPALAMQGLLTGALLGTAQALTLLRTARRALWAAGVTLLWGLGWVITTLIGVDVERQYAVFGASGALVATLGFAILGAVTLSRTSAAAPSTESVTS